MTDAAAFAFRVVECTCGASRTGPHQPTCAKWPAVELMKRNAHAPHRVEVVAISHLGMWSYTPYQTDAEAHCAYLAIIGDCTLMKRARHVRLYIGCELKAERKWRA